jgi:hypothetical protein
MPEFWMIAIVVEIFGGKERGWRRKCRPKRKQVGFMVASPPVWVPKSRSIHSFEKGVNPKLGQYSYLASAATVMKARGGRIRTIQILAVFLGCQALFRL